MRGVEWLRTTRGNAREIRVSKGKLGKLRVEVTYAAISLSFFLQPPLQHLHLSYNAIPS